MNNNLKSKRNKNFEYANSFLNNSNFNKNFYNDIVNSLKSKNINYNKKLMNQIFNKNYIASKELNYLHHLKVKSSQIKNLNNQSFNLRKNYDKKIKLKRVIVKKSCLEKIEIKNNNEIIKLKNEKINKKYKLYKNEIKYYLILIKKALNLGWYFQIPIINNKYKFYITKGNNKNLISHILKNRKCWYETNKDDPELNLYWSQKIDNKFINSNQIYFGKKLNGKVSLKKSNIGDINYINTTLKDFFISLNIKKIKNIKIHNHLPNNHIYGTKKNLKLIFEKYLIQNNYNVSDFLPKTFLIINEVDNNDFYLFEKEFDRIKSNKENKNIWILKPGENSNQGNGIILLNDKKKIKDYILSVNTKFETTLIQKYYENPLLVNKRKFDLRIFCLITNFNYKKRLYFYNIGYTRTTSFDYSLKNINNLFLHLTNEEVQKKNTQFGKIEKGNKIKIKELIKILKDENAELVEDYNVLYANLMKNIKEKIKICFKSYFSFIENQDKIIGPCFELFGLDFLLEKNLNPLLIEINYNPSLVTTSNLSSKIIMGLLENIFSFVIDPIFPPKISNLKEKKIINNFEELNLND